VREGLACYRSFSTMRKGSGRRVGSLATGRNDHMTASDAVDGSSTGT